MAELSNHYSTLCFTKCYYIRVMHMEAEEEKALWLWERNEWEQGILFSIIPFERMIYVSTNWCRTCDNWALASETVQGRHSTSRNSYCSYCTCDSRKTHSQHMYRGWGGGHLRNHGTWKCENKQSEILEPGRSTETCAAGSLLVTQILPRTGYCSI